MKIRYFIICIFAVCSVVAYGQQRNRSAVNQQKIEELKAGIEKKKRQLQALRDSINANKERWMKICGETIKSGNYTIEDLDYMIDNTDTVVDVLEVTPESVVRVDETTKIQMDLYNTLIWYKNQLIKGNGKGTEKPKAGSGSKQKRESLNTSENGNNNSKNEWDGFK